MCQRYDTLIGDLGKKYICVRDIIHLSYYTLIGDMGKKYICVRDMIHLLEIWVKLYMFQLMTANDSH